MIAFYRLDVNVSGDEKQIQHIAPTLMMWLQAYDLLKTAQKLSPAEMDLADTSRWCRSTGKRYPLPERDHDRNEGDCSPRNKLRYFMHDYADEANDVINSSVGWKKNHGLIAASALGMGAVVLNDAGASNWRGNDWYPKTWAKMAEEGMKDNLFRGLHNFLATNVPQADMDKQAGYAEGPGYWNYAARCLIPAWVSMNNQYGSLYSDHIPHSWLFRPEIQRIFWWYDNIMGPGQYVPSYDNSGFFSTNIQALTGFGVFDYGTTNEMVGDNYDLLADYIVNVAVNRDGFKPREKEQLTIMPDAGNAILRPRDGKGRTHYFHMLFETGTAVDKEAYDYRLVEDGTHEDEDMGSFMIHAPSGNPLAIDPPYFGYDNVNKTNKYDDHNVIRFMKCSVTPDYFHQTAQLLDSYAYGSRSGFEISYSAETTQDSSLPVKVGDIRRAVGAYSTAGHVYYMLTDHADALSGTDLTGIRWQLNGNGVAPYSFENNNQVSLWFNPCASATDNSAATWNLLAHQAFMDKANKSLYTFPNTTATGPNATVDNGITPSSVHSRIEYFLQGTSHVVLSFLYPYQCQEMTDQKLPGIGRVEETDYVSTLLSFDQLIDTTITRFGKNSDPNPLTSIQDTIRDFHLVKGNVSTLSITDPFAENTGAVLVTDAEHTYLSKGQYSKVASGFCEASFTKFKKAEIRKGTTLSFNDTAYIRALSVATIYYELIGKYEYSGYISSDTSTSVTFFLPDMGAGYEMAAFDASGQISYPVIYSQDSFMMLTVAFPAGSSSFVLKMADPCAASCFFPPTSAPIDTTFDFAGDQLQCLGHDLDIVPGQGWLKMKDAAKMNICTNFTLVNRDSITMESSFKEQQFPVFSEYSENGTPLNDNIINRLKSKRTMIIVNNKAALVLDSGSYTHVGINSTILVRKGGTLLIRKGAVLEIGSYSDDANDFGEVIAEDGAYLCIEDGADIHFYDSVSQDTLDKNIFYVSMKPVNAAVADCNPQGANGKFLSTGRFATHQCVPFCDLKIKNAPYGIGINNKPFGWSNINFPVAEFGMKDTLCGEIPLFIHAASSLNETGYTIKICQYDPVLETCSGSEQMINSTGDTMRLTDNMLVRDTLSAGSHYRVRLICENSCNEKDTLDKYVYVIPEMQTIFAMADTACPGTGTVVADGSASTTGLSYFRHSWSVTRVVPVSHNIIDDLNNYYGMEWTFDSSLAVSDSFAFPGFTFKGGAAYAVTLAIEGYCSSQTYSDTVIVPLGVSILKDTLSLYPGVTGHTTVRLYSTASGYSSLTWSPGTDLDTTYILRPVADPGTNTIYTLTGSDNNGCTENDSVLVKVLHFARAADDQVICTGDSVNIGIPCLTEPFIPCFPGLTGMLFWLPQDGLSDPYALSPKAGPDSTTQYTMYYVIVEDGGIGWEPTSDTIEFDRVTVYVDKALTPVFYLSHQVDSTAWFANITPGETPATIYKWDFGDGDSSFQKNSYHTFPKFDTLYTVCLSVMNRCDTLITCDSIFIDSIGIMHSVLGKGLSWNTANKENTGDAATGNYPEGPGNILHINHPNPFSDKTLISYELGSGVRNAEIRISTPLGQQVKVIRLLSEKGTVTVDGSSWPKGMYYYSLIVDGTVISSKAMVIER